MTARIRDYLKSRRESGQDEGPVLVVDLDVVRTNYQNFAKALPDSRVFYAVKANPAPEVLSLLASLGSCFDTASVPEIEMVLAAGATADRISYGNTIKKERDIAKAYGLGVRLYAVDCNAEVEKIARAAPGSRVFCRILSDCVGAEWPLSRRFFRNSRMRAVMLRVPQWLRRHGGRGDAGVREPPWCAMGTHFRRGLWQPLQSALVWIGETPHRTAGKDGQASSVTRAGGGDRQKTREARSVVALSRAPR